jgi:heterodisulfide reductase subunit B
MECCGYPVEKTDEDLSLTMIEGKLNSIEKSGANCVVVVCPACYMQYDFKQRSLNQKKETEYNMPIFYLSELMALAFGFDQKEIGLKFHTTKVNSLLEELEF